MLNVFFNRYFKDIDEFLYFFKSNVGVFIVGGGRVFLVGIGDVEVLLDSVFLVKYVCVVLVNMYIFFI